MVRFLSIALAALAIGLGIGFAYNKFGSRGESVVNVYSSRKEELVRDLFKKFTAETGIEVRYVRDKAPQLITRMESEGVYSKADLLLTADATNLILAKNKGLLQPIRSAKLENSIPASLRDGEGYWFGLTKRARIVVYNKGMVDVGKLSTYEDLADPKWRNLLLVSSSNRPYNQSLIAFMIAHNGMDAARKWVRGLVRNMARAPAGGDTDQIRAVAAGEGAIAIVNSYYFGRISSSEDPEDKKVASKVGIFFPNQNTTGAMINISGGGVAKHAKNKANALRLLEFLVSKEAQEIYAHSNKEYPLVEGVSSADILESWGSFKESTLPLRELERYLPESVQLADEEGWK
ncbi:iron uptake protein A1 [Anaplasma platys]|uniref:Iron uptake protein A1 n=1 Tax=Anaplasma platys TaxID=949 RepID=A0A858PX90_9RICK|nr:iron uptake protein A1 [Anaplasma platys]